MCCRHVAVHRIRYTADVNPDTCSDIAVAVSYLYDTRNITGGAAVQPTWACDRARLDPSTASMRLAATFATANDVVPFLALFGQANRAVQLMAALNVG